MRKSKSESADTRKRIVAAASNEFRRNGIEGTGLTDLMSAAGLTHGGFYKHFDSKNEVVEEAFALAADSMVNSLKATLLSLPGDRGVHRAIADYLSIENRDNAADGCPFVALGSEVARGGHVVREVATTGYLKLVEVFADQLKDRSPAAAKKDAIVMLSTMIGAMTMARAVNDPKLSESILRQAYKHLTRSP